jgi:hypothetical protein
MPCSDFFFLSFDWKQWREPRGQCFCPTEKSKTRRSMHLRDQSSDRMRERERERERYVTGSIRRMCMQGRGHSIEWGQAHACIRLVVVDWGYGGAAATRSREACIIVQAAKLAVKSHLVQGEGSHEVGEVRERDNRWPWAMAWGTCEAVTRGGRESACHAWTSFLPSLQEQQRPAPCRQAERRRRSRARQLLQANQWRLESRPRPPPERTT